MGGPPWNGELPKITLGASAIQNVKVAESPAARPVLDSQRMALPSVELPPPVTVGAFQPPGSVKLLGVEGR